VVIIGDKLSKHCEPSDVGKGSSGNHFLVVLLIAELQRAKRASEAPWVRKIGNPSS